MVSVIVVSFNTQEITLKCLRHVYASKSIDLEVVVVDNASTDGSVAAIIKQFSKITLIENKTNVGFGAANNQAMKVARGDLFLLLNSDVFIEEDTIKKCEEYLDQHSNVSVIGCKLINQDGGHQQSVGYFPTLIRVVGHIVFALPTVHIKKETQTREVDWVTGALMLVRKEVFTKTQGFDEQFFMYGEEVEWQYRIRLAGYKVNFFTGATAIHLGGASTGDKTKMFVGEMEGYVYWFGKYGNSWEKIVLPWILRAGCVLRILAFTVVGKPEMAKTYSRVLASVPAK